MPQTLNHHSTTATAVATINPLSSLFSNPNFLSKPYYFPSLPRRRTPPFPILSSKTTTNAATINKPTKIPQLPSNPHYLKPQNHHPLNPISEFHIPNPEEFQAKALYLDSIGLDSLSLLTTHHHHRHHQPLPAAVVVAAASLTDLKSLFDYLTSFNFSPSDLRRIVTMCPDILSLNLNDVVSVFTFLLREVHLSGSDLPRVISNRPRILVCSVESRLRPTLYFLQSIGIDEVNKHTNLLSSSVEEKFMPKIQFFEEKAGFCYKDSITMFRRFPALFCYSIKGNFEPKFNYFVVEMGRDLKELKDFPQYFSFSLERRIKPRHRSCVENGVCLSLPVMLKLKEEKFRQRLDLCCNSSMPRSDSPLWCANNCDVNS